ncbi:hypothetical protein DV736_g1649, partial [Chaetothyriales sp. CBS 134916]
MSPSSMVTANGTIDSTDAVQPPANHLGKRKRSESPRKLINGNHVLDFQNQLRTALTGIHRSAPADALLKHSLPPESPKQADVKRARLGSDDHDEKSTVEARIQAGSYTSLDDLKADVLRVQEALLRQDDKVNGDSKADPGHDNAADLVALLAAEFESTPKMAEMAPSNRQQIITLRSQTEKGSQQLYSGLQVSTKDGDDAGGGDVASIDGRLLPNGFDVADAATINSELLAPPKDKRLFGDVFRPRASLKQLEQPRPRQANTATTLRFEKVLVPDRTSPIHRSDYKYQPLPTSTWLTYSKGTRSNEPEAIIKQRALSSLNATDYRVSLAANAVAGNQAENTDALFKAAFSSFAPAYDSTKGLVNDADRNRSYWRRFGRRRLDQIFQSDYPRVEEPSSSEAPANDDNFDDVVANFQPTDHDPAAAEHDDNPDSVDDVLEEVSQLLETVYSYQQIRAASNHNSDISRDEFDAYEILRSQLSILVSSLPPFAVAKLDGDKLNDLAISTTILVEGVDYRGTGQPDDYTIQKYRAAQQATSTTTRPAQPQQSARNQYPTPATTQRYNTAYNPIASQPTYNRPMAAGSYQQTPTSQRQFQTNSYNAQSAVQQFQRPLQNGYPYNANGQPGQAYPQTPSQPGYQQRAQQQAAQHPVAYARTASPSKPLVNGQTPYYNQATANQQRAQQTFSPAPPTIPAQPALNAT